MTDEERRIDEMADLHERIGKLESRDVLLSRRITALEEAGRGHYDDNPMSSLLSPSFLLVIAALTLLPVVVDVWKQWRLSSSQS